MYFWSIKKLLLKPISRFVVDCTILSTLLSDNTIIKAHTTSGRTAKSNIRRQEWDHNYEQLYSIHTHIFVDSLTFSNGFSSYSTPHLNGVWLPHTHAESPLLLVSVHLQNANSAPQLNWWCCRYYLIPTPRWAATRRRCELLLVLLADSVLMARLQLP